MPNVVDCPVADRPDGLTGVYERGVWRSLRRTLRLNYDESELTGPPSLRGPMLLEHAVNYVGTLGHVPYTTLGPAGQPVSTAFTVGQVDCPFSNLVLVNMVPKIVAQNNWVDVELQYEHVTDGHNQLLPSPASGRVFVKGRSSIAEKPTNFYYVPDKPRTLANRRLIKVAHTYVSDEAYGAIPNAPYDPILPRTVVWTGEVNIPFAQQGFTIQCLWLTHNIQNDINALLAHVNKDAILGRPTRTWLCTEFAWELHSAAKKPLFRGKAAYKVQIEFQYNSDTWDKTVVFIDQRLGRPPADISPAARNDADGVHNIVTNPINLFSDQPAGYWEVPNLEEQDFANYFGGVVFEKVGP